MLFKSQGPCHQHAAGCVSHVSSMAWPVFLLDAQDQLSPGPIVSNLVQILNILLKNDVKSGPVSFQPVQSTRAITFGRIYLILPHGVNLLENLLCPVHWNFTLLVWLEEWVFNQITWIWDDLHSGRDPSAWRRASWRRWAAAALWGTSRAPSLRPSPCSRLKLRRSALCSSVLQQLSQQRRRRHMILCLTNWHHPAAGQARDEQIVLFFVHRAPIGSIAAEQELR